MRCILSYAGVRRVTVYIPVEGRRVTTKQAKGGGDETQGLTWDRWCTEAFLSYSWACEGLSRVGVRRKMRQQAEGSEEDEGRN